MTGFQLVFFFLGGGYFLFFIFLCYFLFFPCKYFYVSIQFFLLTLSCPVSKFEWFRRALFVHFFNFSTIVLQNNSAALKRCVFISRVFLLRLKKGLSILNLYCLVITKNQIDLNKPAVKTYIQTCLSMYAYFILFG